MLRYKAFFILVYTCGLRSSEALALTPMDIDSAKGCVRVIKSKGKRTREVPIVLSTIMILREFWLTHRNPLFIFPATSRNKKNAGISTKSMPLKTAQDVFRDIRTELKITKKITIHTLRHCYATHLLDAGVNIRMVQMFLGHASIQTTCIYLHVTKYGLKESKKVINKLFDGGNEHE